MAKKPRIFIGLTSQRFVFSRTVFALMGALKAADYEYIFSAEMACDIAAARNRLAKLAVESKTTHLLFVDYDMWFPPDAISKLLKEDKDIIGATYNKRSETNPENTAVPVTEASDTDLYKCQTLGAGLLLIKTSVFEKLKSPWFLFGYDQDGSMRYGEDTYFCQRAINECGFDVWAHPTTGTKHVGEHLF